MTVMCNKGHYYDNELYAACPVCARETYGGTTTGLGEIDPQNSVQNMPSGAGDSGSTVSPQSDNDQTIGFLNPGYQAFGGYTIGQGVPEPVSNPIPGEIAKREQTIADPVVGWMVCIKGNNFGKAFPLFYGRNFVGRLDINDVCLQGDQTIARDKHAVIVYEPKERKFFAMPGDARSIYYVNEKVVLGGTELKSHDILEIGATKLLFVPLCNEKFGWDEVDRF